MPQGRRVGGRGRISQHRCAAPQTQVNEEERTRYCWAVSDSEGELQGLWGQQQLFHTHTSNTGMARHLPLPLPDKPSIEGCAGPSQPTSAFCSRPAARLGARRKELASAQGPLPTALAPGQRGDAVCPGLGARGTAARPDCWQ